VISQKSADRKMADRKIRNSIFLSAIFLSAIFLSAIFLSGHQPVEFIFVQVSASNSSRNFLRSMPPPYPVSLPFDPITR
jgi:hypothetical protein